MKIYHFTSDNALAGRCPFDDEFSQDPWIAYHGSSNHTEPQIESQGIFWQADNYCQADVLVVLNIFDLLHWSGRQQGGFGVLASFAQADFQKSNYHNRKPVFVAETSFLSVLYASKDFAGGETARALRLALADLREYLNNPTFRKNAIAESWKHLRNSTPFPVPSDCVPQDMEDVSFHSIQALWRYFESFGSRVGVGGRPGIEPCAYSDAWLRKKLAEIEEVQASCDKLLSNYLYGVVYAVRFTEADLPHLACDRAGLVFDGVLSPDRILAKAIISRDVGYPDTIFDKHNKLRGQFILEKTGLRAKLR